MTLCRFVADSSKRLGQDQVGVFGVNSGGKPTKNITSNQIICEVICD